MSDRRINRKYIADFFGIGDSEEDKAELAELGTKLKKIVYENGEDICRIDEEPDGMFFIEAGSVAVLDKDGKQVNRLHAGHYFGEYAVLSGQNRLSTVRSLGRTVVFKMESEDVLYFLSKHPGVYGELMKRAYGQISQKHTQILTLSGMHRGVLTHPANEHPMTKIRMLIHYGILACVYLAALFLIPTDTAFPVFVLPLVFMLFYVLVSRRTVESLVTSGIFAAILVYRVGVFTGYADSLMETMGQHDNVFTVLVMALMGGMINLIIASGGVTAFEKSTAKFCTTNRRMFLTSLGIMAVTSIDDGLNMLTASYSTYKPAREQGVVRERLALFYSMLPTVLSSFLPISLWGIFVTGTLYATVGEKATGMFVKSIPFNFYSLITLAAMILFSCGLLPWNRQLKEAQKRYDEKGELFPKGSEKYLSAHEAEIWGRKSNVIIPIIILGVTSLAARSIINRSFVTDSAVGLVVTIAFMFLLFCFRKVMTPEQFADNLIEGISDSTLPIILYLLTINFSTLLDALGLHVYLAEAIGAFKSAAFLLPAITFVISMLLTVVLGSSWSMYAIAFPIVIGMATPLGISPVLMIGAVAGAGIAGEKNCAFTADAVNVGTAVGINPEAVKKLRMHYSIIFTAIATLLYLIAGICMIRL
ncbi:MAG: cyclic nucleotide-binding domain-containing protein [Lachnospiraceae bacterium]|nr:cyclic nucleotide-binding domain-containing protein [Lachnospiraceae bacterium]